jgi:outer membrane protein assembly factor BamB
MGRDVRKRKWGGYLLGIIWVVGLILFVVNMTIPRSTSHAQGGDWPTYMGSNERSGFNGSETSINPTTAPNLKLHWKYKAGGVISTQPVTFNGQIYWGSWDGFEHATTLSGTQVWATNLGKTTALSCTPSNVGVASTASVVSLNGTSVVFVGGGNGTFYALNAANGSVIWKTLLGSSPSHFLWSSPAFYNGNVYEGVASFGDCPEVHGQLVQMSATTGVIQNVFDVVPTHCIGGPVWGSPTIDTAGDLYFGTGNGGSCSVAEPRAVALVELHADLSFVGSWQVPASQQFTKDSDFGSTPTLFTATIGGALHQMVGIVNKNGIYYAFDRTNISAGPLWEKRVSSAPNNISPSAWDGVKLYEGSSKTIINGLSCGGSVRALDPASGGYLWEHCTPSKVIDAVTLVPGLVIAGDSKNLLVLDAKSGQQLFTYHDATTGSYFYGAASVSNGVLYIGNKDGNLYAFGQ